MPDAAESGMLRRRERVGPYLIEAFLGHGTVASVYGARRQSDRSRVALKVLTAGLTMELYQRLHREAQVLAAVRHENVVEIHGMCQTRLGPAFILARIDGITLEDLLESYRLTEVEALEVFAAMIRGIGAAHETGVVHRDLKPANVLLQSSERGMTVKIADFGLAKMVTTGPGLQPHSHGHVLRRALLHADRATQGQQAGR